MPKSMRFLCGTTEARSHEMSQGCVYDRMLFLGIVFLSVGNQAFP